jgi:hypothetical protein
MSIITQSIANADREARYLSRGELNALRSFFEDGDQRLRIASILSANVDTIVEKGSEAFGSAVRLPLATAAIPPFGPPVCAIRAGTCG